MTNRYFYDPDKAARLAAIAATDAQIDANEGVFRTEDVGGGGTETFPQAVHDAEDHTGIPGVGGGTALSLLGPFTVNFNDAGLGVDGIALTLLDSGTVVIGAWIVMVTPWENATLFTVALGGPDYGPPDDDYVTLVATDPKGTATVANGVRLSPEDVDTTHFLGVLSADGALVAYCFEDPPGNQGQAQVYALVKTP